MRRTTNFELLSMALLAVILLALAAVPDACAASQYKTLFVFTVGHDRGIRPRGGLIFDQAGNLYGTTIGGGAHGAGTVFKLTSNGNGTWTQSVLYSFKAGNDGAGPEASMIFDQAGNLYGTTAAGGSSNGGTVFRLTPNGDTWSESVLYSFPFACAPVAGLIFDTDGNLYGTTSAGGAHSSGTVFRLTPSGTESVLYSFCSLAKCHDGEDPLAGLIFDQSGNLYGTTSHGGAFNRGTVFKLTAGGGHWTASVLHSFTGENDGSEPVAGLIFDTAGNLYGTTATGGANVFGVVFKLAPNAKGGWNERVLRNFTGSKGGASPAAGLIFDQNGNLYGTTLHGGPHEHGVAFRLEPNTNGGWHETVFVYFNADPGAIPYSGLIFDTVGNLYGTTFGRGHFDPGSVYEITP
jgi:uncharacterized repeat protein (TIGR03803 family)